MQRPYSRAGRDSVYHERPQTRHGRHSPPPHQQDMYERPQTRHGRRTPPSESVPMQQTSGAEADILILDSSASSSAPAPAPSPTPPRPQPKMRPKSAKGRTRPRPMPRPNVELAGEKLSFVTKMDNYKDGSSNYQSHINKMQNLEKKINLDSFNF